MSNELTFATPFTLPQGQTLKNRFFKSAMSEQLGDRQHNPPSKLARLYRTWAEGGLGLAVTGNVMIERTALGEPKNVVLDTQSDLAAFRQWAEQGQVNGCQLWMQLNHPGKQIPSYLAKEPVAPSAISLGGGLEYAFNKPRALTEPEILDIIGKFATAARLAKETGFAGVQIHGAHGYLVSQFLSPRHNQRTDQWGGSAESRRRFVLELYRAIREAVGADFPVGIKLNSADFMKGGFTEEESMDVVKALADAGIDLIEISGGTYESPSMVGYKIKDSTLQREAYFLEYAEKVRKLVATPIVVTGGFRSGRAMLQALNSGATDLIGLARPLAVQPDLPNRLLAEANYRIEMKRPSTGVNLVDRFSGLDIIWYEFQLERIAEGKRTKPDSSAWLAVVNTIGRMGVHAFAKRRA